MAYCVKCGVELDKGLKRCPLCNTAVIFIEDNLDSEARRYPDPDIEKVVIEYSTEKKFKKALELVTILFLTPFFIIMSIDIIVNQSFTWSRIPLITLLYVWLMCFYPLFFRGNIPIIVVGEMISVTTFIGLLDFLEDYRFEWFLPIAAPILIVLFILMMIISFLTIKSERKGFNIAGYILGAIGIFCLLLELIISLFILNTVILDWSLFVFFPCAILSFTTLYIHYRYKSFDLLRKFFDF